jgi:putative Holliday junction resolvase
VRIFSWGEIARRGVGAGPWPKTPRHRGLVRGVWPLRASLRLRSFVHGGRPRGGFRGKMHALRLLCPRMSPFLPESDVTPVECRGRVIGVDLGLKRVGVSISDETNTFASPLATLTYRVARISQKISRSWQGSTAPGRLWSVFQRVWTALWGLRAGAPEGLPRFSERHSGIPVCLSDERLTTSQAEKEMIALGKSRRQRKRTIDGASAVLILENHLRAHRDDDPS